MYRCEYNLDTDWQNRQSNKQTNTYTFPILVHSTDCYSMPLGYLGYDDTVKHWGPSTGSVVLVSYVITLGEHNINYFCDFFIVSPMACLSWGQVGGCQGSSCSTETGTPTLTVSSVPILELEMANAKSTWSETPVLTAIFLWFKLTNEQTAHLIASDHRRP